MISPFKILFYLLKKIVAVDHNVLIFVQTFDNQPVYSIFINNTGARSIGKLNFFSNFYFPGRKQKILYETLAVVQNNVHKYFSSWSMYVIVAEINEFKIAKL